MKHTLICPELVSNLFKTGKMTTDNFLFGLPVVVLAISKYILIDKCVLGCSSMVYVEIYLENN